jgi:hypothetical protein
LPQENREVRQKAKNVYQQRTRNRGDNDGEHKSGHGETFSTPSPTAIPTFLFTSASPEQL